MASSNGAKAARSTKYLNALRWDVISVYGISWKWQGVVELRDTVLEAHAQDSQSQMNIGEHALESGLANGKDQYLPHLDVLTPKDADSPRTPSAAPRASTYDLHTPCALPRLG